MERAFQYMWKYGVAPRPMLTCDGQRLRVMSPGRLNTDAGPDFSAAKISIDGEVWAGNVEVHVRATDWYRHGHHTDPAYDSVVLHVVGRNDGRIPRQDGSLIPQFTLHVPARALHLYQRLSQKISAVECAVYLREADPLTVTDWLESLAAERMERKARDILALLDWSGHDWERVCFVVLARSLGFSLNSDPLEMTARSLPLSVCARHSDDLFQLEALVFGQAGLLSGECQQGCYQSRLQMEYAFLARKYDLHPVAEGIWKLARTRPQNFPHRRLAMLAASLQGGFRLLSHILESPCEPESYAALLDWQPSEHWRHHFDFNAEGRTFSPSLSANARRLLLINFIAPLLCAYGASVSDPEMAGRGQRLWAALNAEDNTYIRQWVAAGITPADAGQSQALIQLRREYCDRSRCLECRFGHSYLRQTAKMAES